jgi:putative membrane protein
MTDRRMRGLGIVVLSPMFFAMPVALAQTPPPSEAAAAPTDAQIAEIVLVANQVDIDAGKLAKKQTKNADVKEFANTMIRDHEAINKKVRELATKLKVHPEPSATSKSLKQGGEENLAALKKLKGKEFDKAYVDQEVTYHQKVLDAVNTTLIPNAKNPELKALLEQSAPAFQAHLDHAKKLQTDLASGTATKSDIAK